MAFKLPPGEVAKLKEAQRQLHDVLPEIDKAEECGVECQHYRELHAEVGRRLAAILDKFGPVVK